MFLSQELIDRLFIRVIAAGGPHQQGTREGDDDDAKHGHRGNGLAQYRRGDDHAHGGVDGEQRADHARDVMRPDSTAYAPPTIMFSASA